MLWKQKLRRVWARTVPDLHREAARLDAYFRKLKLDGAGIRGVHRGKWSPRSAAGDRPVDRVAAFRRYHALGP
jgi:hypothetical protein